MKLIPLIAFLFVSFAWATEPGSPYAGQQHRQIKALSKAELDGYLSGKGMGFAKAAELNDFPGPKHVLELSEELQLTEEQLGETKPLFNSMQARAIELGQLLVEKEKGLDSVFAGKTITPEELEVVLFEIADIRAKLRYTHLEAHLSQKKLLTSRQVHEYKRSRGYMDHSGHH